MIFSRVVKDAWAPRGDRAGLIPEALKMLVLFSRMVKDARAPGGFNPGRARFQHMCFLGYV